MTFKEKVNCAVVQELEARLDLFLIELKIDDSNKISIILDGDNGVNLQDCIAISRTVETNLDREEQDFSLEVASAGISRPLQMPRQYVKNIGRKLVVKTNTGEVIEAAITAANEEQITLKWTAREQKKIGKGKETVEKSLTLPYSEIKEATVIISF
jgi:ribosome maturation factor RimP